MKKIVRLWYLYDFANSFASVVLLFYYPLILSEKGASNNWIGISASIATGILLVVLPYLGAYSDRTGRRIYFIRLASVLMLLAILMMAYLTQKLPVFSTLTLIILSGLYIIFQVCFQGSYVFYSAMLRSIANVENNAKISGRGLSFGQLGNVIALGILGPIIGSSLIILGLSGKPLSFLIGGVMFIFISLPFLKQKDSKSNLEPIRFSYKYFLKQIMSEKRIRLFIIGYALLSDAILTFQLYLAIYVRRVFNFSDQMIAYFAMTGLFFTVLGGFMAQGLSNKLKSKEKALRVSSLLYASCFALCATMPQIPVVVFAAIALCGTSYGLVFSLARTVYSEISPADKQGEFFSIFTVFERAASVVGPLIWLLTFYLLKSFGENIQYRGAIILLALICLGGFYYLKKSNQAALDL